jgi:MFS family permease
VDYPPIFEWEVDRHATSAEAPRGRGTRARVRWGIVGMAFLGTTINYVDRANLAVAAPFISDELNLGSFQMGLVLRGFFWTYAVGQLLAGYLVDRYGARLMYTFSAVWWSRAPSYWRLENGHRQARPSTIRKLAAALGVEASELVVSAGDSGNA